MKRERTKLSRFLLRTVRFFEVHNSAAEQGVGRVTTFARPEAAGSADILSAP